MGMYTEILVKCDIRTDILPSNRLALDYLFNRESDTLADKPGHPFFETHRWRMVGVGCSAHIAISVLSNNQIFSHSELKNHNEVDLFFDWLRPLTDACDGDCIGWHWYDECAAPTLVLK